MTATPLPGETPVPAATLPAPTLPPTPEPTPAAVALRVAVFRDDDANALKGLEEPGLAGLNVQVVGSTWSQVFAADAAGVVTITLPGPGSYEISLAGYPAGVAWEPTTRTAMRVRVGDDGSIVFLPAEPALRPVLSLSKDLSKGEDALPIGVAEGAAFAFGLVATASPAAAPIVLWPLYLLLGGVLLWLVQSTGRARIAAAIRERVGIEKRLHESQAGLGHTFIEED
jgi:hypothetical protein